jgi:hypothetical protein
MSIVVGLDGLPLEMPPASNDEPATEASEATEPVAEFVPSPVLILSLERLLEAAKAGVVTSIAVASVGPRASFDFYGPPMSYFDAQRLLATVTQMQTGMAMALRASDRDVTSCQDFPT